MGEWCVVCDPTHTLVRLTCEFAQMVRDTKDELYICSTSKYKINSF